MTATSENEYPRYLDGELEFVRRSYVNGAEETQRLERYAVVTAAALWSWCATKRGDPVVTALIWLPVVSSILFGLRAWAIGRQIQEVRRYLQKVEQHVGLPSQLGWERSRSAKSLNVRVATSYVFWAILECTSVGLATYVSLE
jgi:hypothetical protein